jgi:hypothetical protein
MFERRGSSGNVRWAKRAYAQAFARTQNAAHARFTVMRKIVAVMRAMRINQTPYRDELG